MEAEEIIERSKEEEGHERTGKIIRSNARQHFRKRYDQEAGKSNVPRNLTSLLQPHTHTAE